MQDNDTRALAERIDDPAVRVRVVADVVERNVAAARGTPPVLRDFDLDPLLERGEQMSTKQGWP